MEDIQNFTLVILSLILFVGLILPELFKKFKFPLITPLLLLGAILGPFGFDIIQSNEIVEFLGFLGVSFLMLMAGLEINVKEIKKAEKPISEMAILNGVIPFFTGLIITRIFGYPWETSILVGTIFISSSIGIIIPSLTGGNLVKKRARRMIVSSIVLEDVASLILLTFILQGVAPITSIPLPLYFFILLATVYLLKLLIPKLAKQVLSKKLFRKREEYEEQLRFVLFMLIVVLLIFSALGIHSILAAFLVGVLLSDAVTHEQLYQKLHTLAYGLFVPVFFFVVGMQMDLGILVNFDLKNVLLIVLVVGLIGSKVLSGFLGGKLAGLDTRESGVFGVLSTIQLTTALAITYSAASVGLLDQTLTTAIVFLTITTTLAVPAILKLFAAK